MATAKELMRRGELYPGDDPELNRELNRRQILLAALNAIPYERLEARRAAFEGLLARIGADTFIRTPFYCDYGDGIEVGDGTSSTSTARCSTARLSRSETSACLRPACS